MYQLSCPIASDPEIPSADLTVTFFRNLPTRFPFCIAKHKSEIINVLWRGGNDRRCVYYADMIA
jgi:hypothetical protein